MSIYSIHLKSNENTSSVATFEMYALSTIACVSLALIASCFS